MERRTTRIEYGRRVARVMDHIAAHLDEDLTLERLADVACFSPYHFHRIYRWIAGETAADTIRRLRLQKAAYDLVGTDRSIEDVARRAGYGSAQAFTRAFATDHGRPPGAFRTRRRGSPIPPEDGDDTMQTTIKTFEGVALAALDHQGSYEEIGRTFDRLTAWAGGLGLLDGNRRWFAIYEDDPDSVPVGRLRSQAGFEAGPEVPLMEGMRRIALAPGRMATTVHQGPYADLHRVYRSLYRDWLPGSGEEADDRPCFEEYLNDPRRTRPSDLLTEVFLPLKG